MIRVKSLMQQANPVPETAPEEPARPSERRMRRRGLLVLSGAVAAVAAVTLVTVYGSQGGGFGGRTAEPPAADEPYYTTTGDLEQSADVIVRARLVATRETDEDGVPETTATVSVVATGKGEVPGRTIQVSYTSPGAALPSGPELTPRHEYVLLLDHTDGRYFPVNTTQGYYGIEAGHAKAGPDNRVALSDGVLKAMRLTR